MRGHIKKRGKDSYSVVISLGRDPATDKYRYLWESVKGTKREAERRLSEVLNQIDNGTFSRPSKRTLAEYLETWLKEYVWTELAPRTAEGYDLVVHRHLIPALGNITLTGLKPEHVQRYQSEKLSCGRADGGGGLSARTVRHHYMALHAALERAVKIGLVSRNVADAVSPPRFQRHQWQSLSEFGVSSVLEAASETPYYVLFCQPLFTGMRRSELLALRWCDVDLVLGRVQVTRSLHQLKGSEIVVRSPKSERSRRSVSLPPSAIVVFQEERERQQRERAAVGSELKDDDLIFRDLEGRPLRPDTVTHAWVKLVRRIGLRGDPAA